MAEPGNAAPTDASMPEAEEAEEFDYVIIGGGSAGCVLASRLSEDEDVRVCLLEAGGRGNNMLVNMPLGAGRLMGGTICNWAYETEGQPWLHNRCLFWPRGKALGGSSAINGMVYIRGHARDYDHWRQLGLAGWSYADVLPYFRKAECNENGASPFHGGGGFLSVSNPKSGLSVFEDFVRAGEAMGWPRTPDFNGAQQEGAGFYQLTIRDGVRASTARAYLQPAEARRNLDVRVKCLVHRIEFADKRASAVAYERGGRVRRVRARREIVLCGGAVNSPQILLLSGVGPAAYLRGFDIPVVKNLPGVGQNLQDHLDVIAQTEMREPITLDARRTPLGQLMVGARYALLRSGLGRIQGLESGAFVKTDAALDIPDIQLHLVAALVRDHTRVQLPHNGLSLHVCQLRPESRGLVGLKSPAPEEHALIQPNYLSAPRDLQVLRDGLKLARAVLHKPPLAEQTVRELWPGEEVQSDAELDEFIRRTAETIYHPVGTCKMGNDRMAVLDEHARVHGLEGLRVIDASAMPSLVGGNTNAGVIMMAEKLADHMRGLPFRAPEHVRIAEDGEPRRAARRAS